MFITFLRHCDCDADFNLGSNTTRDASLTPLGIQQSEKLEGHFDVVFCSPLRRARETLEKSKITYDELVIEPLVRECMYSINDIIFDENVSDDKIETDKEILDRIKKFHKILLTKIKSGCKKILVLSHYSYISEFTNLYSSQRMELDVGAHTKVEVSKSQVKRRGAGKQESQASCKASQSIKVHSSTSLLEGLEN